MLDRHLCVFSFLFWGKAVLKELDFCGFPPLSLTEMILKDTPTITNHTLYKAVSHSKLK